MNRRTPRLLRALAFAGASLAALAAHASNDASQSLYMIRATDSSPAEVVDAIAAYSKAKNWVYMGANKAKNGEVTLVKVCIPQVGQALWPVGLHVSALLPCGNVGVYQRQGKTEVSLLHPRYMYVLHPHPEVQKAVDIAEPLLKQMLADVAK